MGIAECAKPIICASFCEVKQNLIVSLWLKKGPMESCLQAHLLFRCCSSATFHPLRHDELTVKSQALLLLARLGLCAWVVAATGGKKNCCSGESLPILLQMRNQFSGSGGKIHILQCMERRHEEPRMWWREWKLALWDRSVKLTRRVDRTSHKARLSAANY